MTEFRYDEQSQQIIVTLAGNQPLNADQLVTDAKHWLHEQKTAGHLDGYHLNTRRIKKLFNHRNDQRHLEAFNQAPLTFVAGTTARHNGDIQLGPVEEGSAYAFKLSVTPLDITRSSAGAEGGFQRFLANIADLASGQGYLMGNHSQLHAAYLQWRAGSTVSNRAIGKPYDIHQSLGKRYRLFSHQVRPEIYLVIWDAGLLTDHEALSKMIRSTKEGVAKVNKVGARQYQLLDTELRESLERAIHGPERLGVDLPLSILVGVDTGYSDVPLIDSRDPELDLPKERPATVSVHQPVMAKKLSSDSVTSTAGNASINSTAQSPSTQTHDSGQSEQSQQAIAEMFANPAVPASSPASTVAMGKTSDDIGKAMRVDGDITRNFEHRLIRGSLHVTGSIENGVTLTVAGDLIVDGTIGQATLKVAGNLVVSEAIVTGKDNRIEVKGNLSSHAIANSVLFVHGNIVVSSSIIHSHIEFCRNLIVKDLSHGLLAGGTSKVRDYMICGNIGFPKGDDTILTIGVADLPATQQLDDLKQRKASLDQLKKDWQQTLGKVENSNDKERAEHRLARIQEMLTSLDTKLATALMQHNDNKSQGKTDLGKAHLMVSGHLWENVALYVVGKGYKLPRSVQRVHIAAGMTPPVQKLDFDQLKGVYLDICGKKHS